MSTRAAVGPAPSVLVVDDDPYVRGALEATLQGRGFSVSTAGSGEEALAAISAEQPDVVLLDLVLPGIDGIEVCRRLRAWTRLPILVLSAHGDERLKVAALDEGADDYVTKPFGTEELLARIRAAARRQRSQGDDQPRLTFGRLSIDLPARSVLVDGQAVHLTPTEFALLRVLANNPDRVITHRQLLIQALGPEYADALENLRTFIAQLRRKVELDPSRPTRILTEPGIGYRFRSDAI